MKTKVTSTFQIIGARFNYLNNDFEKEIHELKDKHEGAWGECTYEIIDKVKYFQHKYYRGFLLPDITFAMGEVDQEQVHIELKKDFLFKKIDSGDYNDIPKKHRSRSIIVVQVVDLADVVVGYIPSTANLTYKKMKEFIEKCEHRLFVDLNDTFRDQQGAMENRKLSFKEK